MHKSGDAVSFWSAVAMGIGAIVLSAIYLSGKQLSTLLWIAGAFLLAFGIELALRFFIGRVVGRRGP